MSPDTLVLIARGEKARHEAEEAYRELTRLLRAVNDGITTTAHITTKLADHQARVRSSGGMDRARETSAAD
jgi:hypothetical protein